MFIDDVKITTIAPAASSTATVTQGTGLDTSGFTGTLVIVRLGTPSSNNTLKMTQCDTTGGTYADLGSTAVSSGSDGPLILDVATPRKQFLKYVITRGTATTVDATTIIQYGASSRPITQIAGSVVEQYAWPAEGTA